MKRILFSFLVFGATMFSYCQNIVITDLSAMSVNGGINVNVKTMSGTGSGYLSNEYTITGNVIELSVCYWFDATLPILTFDNDFFIPLANNGNYTVNVHIILSSSQVTCDNFANTDNGTLDVEYTLSIPEFEQNKKEYTLFPNPTNGIIKFSGNELDIKQIDVYDSFGRLIKHLETLTEKRIDFNSLKDGIYIVRIQTDKGNINQKIIIRK